MKKLLVLFSLLWLAACRPAAANLEVSTRVPRATPEQTVASATPEETTAGAAGTPLPTPRSALSPGALLQDYGAAPELTNQVWLNTEGPLRLEQLRGQVVLLDMWTFG